MLRIQSWSSIIDRFRSRLAGWKEKCLSFGERLTMIKSIIGSIGSYLMSIFHVLVTVLNTLEMMRDSFFWGTDLDDHYMHWVRWDNVLVDRVYGGLGVRSLFYYNRALLLRWRWPFFIIQI